MTLSKQSLLQFVEHSVNIYCFKHLENTTKLIKLIKHETIKLKEL